MNEYTKKYLHDILRILGQISTMATAMVFSTFCGVWFGYWLDNSVFDGKTHPWLTIIFFLFGLAGGLRNLFVMGQRLKEREEERDRKQNVITETKD